jgi:hypothetical protein
MSLPHWAASKKSSSGSAKGHVRDRRRCPLPSIASPKRTGKIHLGRPLGRKRFLAGGTMSDASICPASYAAVGCGPVWEFADRNHFTKRTRWHVDFVWFFRPRLADCCAIPSVDRPRVPTASGADLGFTRQSPPELGNSHPSPEGPRRCGPSFWPPPPSPACAAYAPASVPTTIPSAGHVDLPDARLNCRR